MSGRTAPTADVLRNGMRLARAKSGRRNRLTDFVLTGDAMHACS